MMKNVVIMIEIITNSFYLMSISSKPSFNFPFFSSVYSLVVFSFLFLFSLLFILLFTCFCHQLSLLTLCFFSSPQCSNHSPIFNLSWAIFLAGPPPVDAMHPHAPASFTALKYTVLIFTEMHCNYFLHFAPLHLNAMNWDSRGFLLLQLDKSLRA